MRLQPQFAPLDPYSRALLLSRPNPYGQQFPVRQRRRVRLRLGAITPDQAAQTAMPQSSISGKAGFTQAVYNGIVAAAQAGNFTNFNPSGCTGVKPSGATIALTTGGSLALSIAPFTGPAAPFVAVGAGLAELFGAIFAGHSAAVAKERQVECAAVPAASDSLTAIDQAVQAGTITPQQASTGLDNLLSQFTQQVSSITKMDSSQCNAACVWIKTLTAIVAEKKSQYADLAAAASSSSGSLLPSFGTAGASSWLPWAVGAFILYEVFS